MALLTYIFRDSNEQTRLIKASDEISLIRNITHLSAHTDNLSSSSSIDQPNEDKIKEGALDSNFHPAQKSIDKKSY